MHARALTSYIPSLAVVYHLGRTAEVGHYTCAVNSQAYGWVEFDDSSIYPLDHDDVFKNVRADGGVPYVLCYVRKD